MITNAATLAAAPRLESKKRAIQLLREPYRAGRPLNDPVAEIRMLKLLGEIDAEISEFEESACHFNHALQHAREQRDERLLAEVLNSAGFISIRLHRLEEAREYGREAMVICERNRDPAGMARILANEGELQYASGDREQALDRYLRASELLQPLKLPRQLAEMQLNAGMMYSDMFNEKSAFEAYNKAFQTFDSIGDVRGKALTLIAIAHLKAKRGENQGALTLYDQTRKTVQEIGDRYWEASILTGIGLVHESSGEREIAFTYYEQAREKYRELGLRSEAAEAALAAGIVMDDPQRALGHFQNLLKTCQELRDKKIEAVSWRHLGAVHGLLGNKPEALAAYRRALDLYERDSNPRGKAMTIIRFAEMLEKFGRRADAKRAYQAALALSRSNGIQVVERESLFHLARMSREGGRLAEARSFIESAIEIAEVQRTNAGGQRLQSSYFASVQKYFHLYIDLLMTQSARSGDRQLRALAFEQSERARARSLLDELSRAHADYLRWGDPALIARLREIQQRINLSAERRPRSRQEGEDEKESTARSLEATSQLIERDQIEARIRAGGPQDKSSPHPQPSTLREIQLALDEDSLLLEYWLGEERSYVWVITPTTIEGARLPGRAEIEAAARDLSPALSTTALQAGLAPEEAEKRYWRKAEVLSRKILGPIAQKLSAGKLLVVSDGLLQQIPFQPLPIPGTAARSPKSPEPVPEPMMLRHQIVNLPSASALVTLRQQQARRRPPTRTIAVFADAVFEPDDLRFVPAAKSGPQMLAGRSASPSPSPTMLREGPNLRRLYFTDDEAKAIESVTYNLAPLIKTGFEATREAILDPQLRDYRILHFATHGDLNEDQPEFSALVFSLYDPQGRRQSGSIRLHEIYSMELNADLVVLSACQTALGKEIRGEGIIGLTRGFLYAGSQRVMASLWKVEDNSTAQLMKHFYWNLFKRGERPAEALQHAQMALWQTPRTKAPYFWAGFILQGEFK